MFAERWTTDSLFQRPKRSTNLTNASRVQGFVDTYGTLLNLVTDEIVAEWLSTGKAHTVGALRAMFNDARSAKAGRLVDRNPFAELGLKKNKGNAEKDPPSEETVWELIAAGRWIMPGFGGWLQFACFTGMRPGEIDAALEGRGSDKGLVYVNEQWAKNGGGFTLPKNGKKRLAVLTPPAREALLAQPMTGQFCFVNSEGNHWTAGARKPHWHVTRAAVGYEDTLYLATRHFAGWYMTNVLELDSEIVAIALGHEDGGRLVRELYGHRDRRAALDQVARAYEGALVTPLHVLKEEA